MRENAFGILIVNQVMQVILLRMQLIHQSLSRAWVMPRVLVRAVLVVIRIIHVSYNRARNRW